MRHTEQFLDSPSSLLLLLSTDIGCICTSQIFQSSVSDCIRVSCPEEEATAASLQKEECSDCEFFFSFPNKVVILFMVTLEIKVGSPPLPSITASLPLPIIATTVTSEGKTSTITSTASAGGSSYITAASNISTTGAHISSTTMIPPISTSGSSASTSHENTEALFWAMAVTVTLGLFGAAI